MIISKGYNLDSPLNFPVSAFPKRMQDIIYATNKDLAFPIDFIGCSLLFAASTAVGNSCRVKVKLGWEEGVVMYMALVGKPGTSKSHPMDFAIKPLKTKDALSYQQYIQEKQAYDKIMSMPRKEREEKGITDPEVPHFSRRLVSDFTQEALIEILTHNTKGISVYADELAGWFKNFNRYHQGSDLEFWLSSWSQKPVIHDRKCTEAVFIDKPFVGVMGGIQPSLLKSLFKGNKSECGFLDRILFAKPPNLEKSIWSDTEVSSDIFNSWTNILDRLIDLPKYTIQLMSMLKGSSEESRVSSLDTEGEPFVFIFSQKAWDKLLEWQRHNKKLCDEALEENLVGIYSKLEIYIIRLSLLMQTLSWACGEGDFSTVELKAIERAIQLIEYFRAMAEEVYAAIQYSDPLENLSKKMLSLYLQLPDNFKTSEGQQFAGLHNIPIRTFNRFITRKELFEKIDRGHYRKLF